MSYAWTSATIVSRADALKLAESVAQRGTWVGAMTWHLLAEIDELKLIAANRLAELNKRESHELEARRRREVVT